MVTGATRLQRVIREAVAPAVRARVVRHGEVTTSDREDYPKASTTFGSFVVSRRDHGFTSRKEGFVKAFCTNENSYRFLRKFVPVELSIGEPTLSDGQTYQTLEFEARAWYLNQAGL